MMIPSVLAPPALYPGLYRPAAALPLHQTLPSVFPTHSSFLVEDLLRISRPTSAAAAFVNRTVPSASASLPTATTTLSFSGAHALATTRESCSPKTSVPSSKDPTFLKFGVSAILAPSPKTASSPPAIHHLHSKSFPIPARGATGPLRRGNKAPFSTVTNLVSSHRAKPPTHTPLCESDFYQGGGQRREPVMH
ncbi:Homeobox protein DBX1-A [Collichthys lucidus]|uniref:Homeobox protein DBX1-A n=1 Tax=Collichthys lucidus TaxID=240159 RepID=A0A4U5UB20_COLLU|nr:Homeobox protein DBX1-A [Collichthys lucidus]